MPRSHHCSDRSWISSMYYDLSHAYSGCLAGCYDPNLHRCIHGYLFGFALEQGGRHSSSAVAWFTVCLVTQSVISEYVRQIPVIKIV
jgi:hypothetical protein